MISFASELLHYVPYIYMMQYHQLHYITLYRSLVKDDLIHIEYYLCIFMINYLSIHYNWKLIPTAMGTTCPFSSCTNLSDALQPVQCPGTINCGSNSLKHLTVSSIIAKAK